MHTIFKVRILFAQAIRLRRVGRQVWIRKAIRGDKIVAVFVVPDA